MFCLLLYVVAIYLLSHQVHAEACVNQFPWKLDIGIYWATLINNGQNISWSKSCPSLNIMSPNFDPLKKTKLITHGLQPGLVAMRMQFCLDGELDQLIIPYLRMGYNFGVFLWTQFADEKIVNFVHTEDEIYTTRGFVKMRYRVLRNNTKRSGAVETFVKILDAPQDKTVSDYYVEAYRFHFTNNLIFPEIHMIGHSLGTQVTLNTAYLIHTDETIFNKPQRITLLDAVMSPAFKRHFERSPCGRTTSMNMGCMAKYLNYERNASVEYYKSSFINRCIFSSREAADLIKYTAFATLKMHAWGMHPLGSCWDERLLQHVSKIKSYLQDIAYQMNWQHIYVIPYYLMSLLYPPHQCVLSNSTCVASSRVSLSAAMSTAEVLMWSRPVDSDQYKDKLCFHQFDECEIAGHMVHNASTMTPTSRDDLFFLKQCIHISI
jgi:hypothetical protein